MTSHIARDFPERSTAMLRGFGRSLDRAAVVGGVVAVPLAALVSIAALSLLPFLISPIVGAVIGTIAGVAAWRLMLPSGLLRAYEAFSWLGRSEMDRFQARTGSAVPVRRPEIERWLAENPPSPSMQIGRIELLAYLGRFDEARARVRSSCRDRTRGGVRARVAGPVPRLAHRRRRPDRGDARGVRRPDTDTQNRHAADVTIALADSRVRFMRADPAWSVPLADVRPSLGAAAAKVLRRDTVRPLAIIYFVLGLLAGAVAALLAILP